MINKTNLETMLKSIGYVAGKRKNVLEKKYEQYDCVIEVDFNGSGKINYPTDKGMKITRKTTCNFSEPENFVVLECITRLMDKGYRPEHIELEKEWTLGHEKKGGFADILVKDTEGKTLFIVECKTAGTEYKKEFNNTWNDGGQLFSYWQQERNCKWLSLYSSDFDGKEVSYKTETIDCTDDANVLLASKKDNSLLLYADATTVEDLYTVWDETYDHRLCGDIIFREDSQAYKIGIKPLRKGDLKDFTENDKIVNRFEEILRHNNVSDKENAFNRLVALFICKLVDEIQKSDEDIVEFQYKVGTDTYETLQDRLQRLHKEGMEKFMREEIFYIANDYAEKLVQQYTGQKRQNMIDELHKTLRVLKFYTNNDFAFKDVHNEELFYQNGKILVEVVQLFENFRIIGSSDIAVLGELFEQLLSKGFKQNEGQFFTPIPVAHFIWDSLPLERIISNDEGVEYPKIIDYACGAGHFLTQGYKIINSIVEKENFKTNDAERWAEHKIYGIEKDYRLARVSKISLFMYGAGEGNIIFGDGLENYVDKGIIPNSFDILVANPPYSVKAFKPHLKLRDNELEVLEKVSNNGSEIETVFVERIGQLLKPSGIAAVVLPSSILNKENDSFIAARESLLKNFVFKAIVQLGGKTFGATPTNTSILFLEKYSEPPKREKLLQDSVDAIFSSSDITDWEDNIILNTYLDKIDVAKDVYYSVISMSTDYSAWASDKYFGKYYDGFVNGTDYKNKTAQKSFAKLSTQKQIQWMNEHFYLYVHEKEKEKLFYFSLIYNQKTLVITAPNDTKEQEKFLGFKWSDKKGFEGSHDLAHEGVLYSDKDFHSSDKLSGLIYGCFGGQYNQVPNLKKYYHYSMFKDMMDWNILDFKKVINTVPEIVQKNNYPKMELKDIQVKISGSTTKIEASQILDNGSIPVISQTKNKMIEGYVDGVDAITDVPLVLFGDHTCVSKYIDFPFVRGADGTQLIKTNEDICLPEYLSIYLNYVDIPNKDKYERHFKYVKKLSIPVPSITEQRKIIKEVKALEKEIDQIAESIDVANDDIVKKFYDMFGEPIGNSKNWQTDKIGNRCDIITGNTPSRKEKSYYGNFIEWIKSDNINTPNDYLTTATEYLSEKGLKVGRSVESGSILMTCIAGSRDCIGNIAIADRKVSFNQQINAIVPKDNDIWYIYYLLKLSKERIMNAASMNLKGILSKGKLENIEFMFPPEKKQKEFGKYVKDIKDQIQILSINLESKHNEKNALIEDYIG